MKSKMQLKENETVLAKLTPLIPNAKYSMKKYAQKGWIATVINWMYSGKFL